MIIVHGNDTKEYGGNITSCEDVYAHMMRFEGWQRINVRASAERLCMINTSINPPNISRHFLFALFSSSFNSPSEN